MIVFLPTKLRKGNNNNSTRKISQGIKMERTRYEAKVSTKGKAWEIM